MRISWTDEAAEVALREVAALVGGRMPSANELRAHGYGSLPSRLTRTGGMLVWAERLGLASSKDAHSPEFGERWEEYVTAVLRTHHYAAEPQRRHAPFDILVGGNLRVDVKASRYHDYGAVRGFTFWLGKCWQKCDVFALVKVDGPTPAILWVPSSEAQQQTITLTGKHRLNAFTSMGLLDEMAKSLPSSKTSSD